MFPITDPGRADDIRARRRRATLFLGGIGLGAFLILGRGGERTTGWDAGASPGWERSVADQGRLAAEQGRRAAEEGRRAAEEGRRAAERAPGAAAGGTVFAGGQVRREFAVSGPITVDFRCADTLRLTVGGEADARGAVVATVSGRDGDGVAMLSAMTLRDGVIGGDCGTGSGSTLDMALPRGHAVTIQQDGSGDIVGGRFDAPVTVRVDGSGDVRLDAVTGLDAELDGSGDLAVGEVGGGEVTVAMRRSGGLSIRGGRVASLRATMDGSGDLDAAAVDSGPVMVTKRGSGDLTLGQVDTSLQIKASGSGDTSVVRASVAQAQLEQRGSGRIRVEAGRIERLDAVREGGGALSVEASVGDGTLRQSGDGSTEIPNGTLRMVPSGG